ncbi:hypothetical protein I5Q34_14675 [Streptomyces sp. AV19]|uniref:hypothetical protein n=1 Tax=Streptomyces sp. AV19 TaxID=2793068 RepID=UPI0018FED912|nr:hypothetical protein [Streptomyces sp. AV19]MBH1935502.1 hypothetical protein [Streptomyces sp. AV19]MDG4534390.1 hypothetical protein [Streptomyces sp. AV19]
MTARRPLLTAVAAGALLCAGWLVPTANATPSPEHPSPPSRHAVPEKARDASAGTRLADTGSVDTTPYVFGGVGFLAAGGALVTVAVRRSRTAHNA